VDRLTTAARASRSDALFGDGEIAAAAAPANGERLAELRVDEALFLQAVERRVQGAACHRAPCPLADQSPDRHRVRPVVGLRALKDGEEHELFKLTEVCHMPTLQANT
jgi:hypothetical protein